MSRLPRYILPGQLQHVIQRGNNREPIFYEEADYRLYLEKLGDSLPHLLFNWTWGYKWLP